MAEDGCSSGPFGPRNAGSGRRRGNLEAGITCGGAADGALRSSGSSSPGRRWGSCAALGSLSPRSGGRGGGGGARFFFDPVFDDEPRHFLDACFLCRKPLPRHRDIYMYRGDTPFCSEECRQEQIEMDEAREERWSLSVKACAPRKEPQMQKEKAPQGIQVRAAGAVLAV